LGHI
jgi:hypothetical protein